MGLQYIFSVTYILARKRQLMKIIIIISGKNYYVFYAFLSKLELHQIKYDLFIKFLGKLFERVIFTFCFDKTS
jgi:hypothetical protein